MSYRRSGLGEATVGQTQEQVVLARLDEILERQRADARARRWALYIGAASALFAAAKLGIIAVPYIRKMRTEKPQP